ncbi:MAG: hypothetical protein ACKVQW_05145 [Pyrinomonadaceae bacterium]
MKENFKDDQIDLLLQRIVNDAAFDDARVDEIADSPQLWWGVQRKIKAEASAVANTGAGLIRRWLLLGASLSVAALLLAFFFVPRPPENTGEQVANAPARSLRDESNDLEDRVKPVENPSVDPKATNSIETASKPANSVKKAVVDRKSPRPQQPKSRTTTAKSAPIEVKSEFIALSYARNPESGQIVRVKVPSSMMVSLGLVASVEKPANLVNAEILVGDDGMTHAIRFIR